MPAKISQEERLKVLREKYPSLCFEYSHTENYQHYFSFECKLCNQDLYAKAGLSSTFTSEYRRLLKLPPCRCNNRFKTKEMIITDAIHFLTDNERSLYKVLEWESWKTKLIVTCNIHGDKLMRKVTLNKLLHRKVIPRCNDCDADTRRKGLQKKIRFYIRGFNIQRSSGTGY